MIERARFVNVNGYEIELNTNSLPFTELRTEIDTRSSDHHRAQQHGNWPVNTYLGHRLFHLEGDILEDSSASYIQTRLGLINAFTPRPGLGKKQTGTLYITLTGIPEELSAECTIDGWPELPIAALSPARSRFLINLKAFDPRLYGILRTVTATPALNLGTRSYNKTYNKSYSGGTVTSAADAIVQNTGNIEVYPIIKVYGPLTSGALVLSRSDGVTKIVQLGDLVLSSVADTITLDFDKRTAVSASGQDLYKYTFGSDWWTLEPLPLVNTVRLAGSNPGVDTKAEITWRNGHMI